MTRPAAHGQVPTESGDRRPQSSSLPYGELYAPAAVGAPSGPGTSGRHGSRASSSLSWILLQAAAGIVIGILWWLLAPGGLNLLSGNPSLADGTRTDVWLPRDLVLAGLFVLCGCSVAVVLDGKEPDAGVTRRIVLAVAGGAAGALVAWLVGVQAGQWWGPPVDASAHPSAAFSLRSFAVLALWPGATAVSVFLLNLVSLMRRPSP